MNQFDRGFSRRAFMRTSAIGAAAAATLSPFSALARDGFGRRPGNGYGELFETTDETTGLPLLKLPRGFRYLSMGWTGDLLVDGTPTPGGHDGGACLWGGLGRVRYVRNHELSANPSTVSFADPNVTFDPSHCRGGTTTLVFDTWRGRYVESFASLSGTIRNCAGGITPWNSWLSCEETFENKGASGSALLERDHGWVFEVPAFRRANPQPLTGLGRFNHEATATDPRTGIVYETEDTGTSGVYRFVPRQWGDLRSGGQLQMLKVAGAPNLDTSNHAVVELQTGETVNIEWVDIADPEVLGQTDRAAVYNQGAELGGASFSRGEGMWYGNGLIYFACSSGGPAGEGQIWAIDPAAETLSLIYESPGQQVLDNPDNIAVSPGGGLVLCEDGDGDALFMRGLNVHGEIFDLAQNNVVLNGEVKGLTGDFRKREWAGASFTPCGRWLLASIQTPGITFAITGPFGRGGL
jgi:secreted PhoX family phosphatase